MLHFVAVVILLKITAGILFYMLSFSADAQRLCDGADDVALTGVAAYGSGELSPGTVYYKVSSDGILAFAVGKTCLLPAQFIQQTDDGAITDFRSTASVSAVFLPDQNSPVIIEQTILRFYETQNAIYAGILSHDDIASILELCYVLLRQPFVLVGRDMIALYEHPSMNEVDGIKRLGKQQYIAEMTEELMLSKHFHEVAKLVKPFYFRTAASQQSHYCLNILLKGVYFARLVISPIGMGESMPAGAEQLSALLAETCTRLAEMGRFRFGRHENDALHVLLRMIAAGEQGDELSFSEALSAYGWSPMDSYRFLIVRVFNARGWDSQMDAPLAIIQKDLEELWPRSCAVIIGQEIHWLINRFQSDGDGDDQDFFRQLAVYVRENVCRVGASSIFRNITFLPSALSEAAAALELGERRNPSHWFFRFDDYRLTYMLEAIRSRGIDIAMLIHPALQTLLEYDAEHEGDLAETLRVYLECRCNATDAAKQLYVHRTTLFRRIEHIEQLTGIDPEDPKQSIELMLSFHLLSDCKQG